MPLPVPAHRPLLSDNWVFNERADVAALSRLLASWEHHAYAYDLARTPCDGVHVSETTGAFVVGTDNDVLTTSGNRLKFLGEFFVPPPQSFARRLEVWVRGKVSTAGSAGATVSFVSRGTGRIEELTISNTSMGATEGWVQAFVQATPFDVIEVWIKHNSTLDGTTVSAMGMCAWWEPLDGLRSDVTIDAAVDGISQTYFDTADVADSTYQLRWLLRRANQFAGHRPRAVYTKWWDVVIANSVSGQGLFTVDTSYKVYVGDQVGELTASVFLKRVATGVGISSVEVRWDGTLIGTGSLAGLNTFTWTTGLTRGVHELRVTSVANDNASGATATAWTQGVSLWESIANGLPLATGDAQPTAFQSVRDELFASGLPLRRDLAPQGPAGRKVLVQNLYWLWKNRYKRCLVHDNRYHEAPTASGYSLTGAHTADVQAAYRLPGSFSVLGAGFGDTQDVQQFAHALRTSISGRTAPTAFDLKVTAPFTSIQIPVDGTTKRIGGMGAVASTTLGGSNKSVLHWHQPPIEVLTTATGDFEVTVRTLSVSDAQLRNHGRAAGTAFELAGPLLLP